MPANYLASLRSVKLTNIKSLACYYYKFMMYDLFYINLFNPGTVSLQTFGKGMLLHVNV